jgi:hypothetical protein
MLWIVGRTIREKDTIHEEHLARCLKPVGSHPDAACLVFVIGLVVLREGHDTIAPSGKNGARVAYMCYP